MHLLGFRAAYPLRAREVHWGMGRTMAEKILARTSGQAGARAGDYVTARVDRVMAH